MCAFIYQRNKNKINARTRPTSMVTTRSTTTKREDSTEETKQTDSLLFLLVLFRYSPFPCYLVTRRFLTLETVVVVRCCNRYGRD